MLAFVLSQLQFKQIIILLQIELIYCQYFQGHLYQQTQILKQGYFRLDQMSQKKAEQLDLNKEDPSEIEIVTVGIKNPSTETVVPKEHQINVLPSSLSAERAAPPVIPLQEAQNQFTTLKNASQKKEGQNNVEQQEEAVDGEEDENLEQGSDQESNVPDKLSQSQKSEKKAKSNCQSLDQRKDDLPTSRKCFNKLCSSKKIYKKIRSRVQDNKYRFFCKNCYQNYYNNLYCQFCQQIYSNNCENQDDDKWIGCDHCQRWNHIQCEKKFRNKSINELKDKDALYQCLVCSQKTKTTNEKNKKQDKEQVEEKVTTKHKIQINRDQRILVFNKKIENFPNLEYFLQNYSFRLWINQSQIKQDIQHLRATYLRNAPQDPVKNKFKKVKID